MPLFYNYFYYHYYGYIVTIAIIIDSIFINIILIIVTIWYSIAQGCFNILFIATILQWCYSSPLRPMCM